MKLTSQGRLDAMMLIGARRWKFGIAFLSSLVTLYGCGFTPMLAAPDGQSSAAADLAAIKVAYIDNRSGQVLRNDLVDTLTPRGEPDRPEYTLVIRLDEPQQNLAFQRNNSVSFVAYTANAFWSLLDSKGVPVYSGTSSSSQQYAMSNSQYATAVSAQNTRDLVMLDISQDIRNKLAQYLLQTAAAQSPPAGKGVTSR